MSFQAAVLRTVGSPLSIESVDMRSLAPDEVLVRMHAAGVCHTDYEAMAGHFAAPLPAVLGHEGAGVIEKIGANVTGLAVGDHVVCSIYPNCGGCFYCQRTLPMLCEQLPSATGARSPALSSNGSPVHSFLNVSSFAEYAVVPQRGAIKVPHDLPHDRACLLGCAVITGAGAVLRIARVQPGESVVVVGCGAVGLNVLQGACMAGAELRIAIDKSPQKLLRAREFGATHTFLADEEYLPQKLRDLTCRARRRSRI